MSNAEFQTHKPSGAAAYPIVLLSGVEGGGKSWTAAAATGLPGFHEKYWLEFGEQMAEEYGGVPGADYQVIEMDGSYKQLLGAAQWAAKQSQQQEAPSMLVFDSVTKLWEMLSYEQQIEANARAARKGKRTDGDAQVTVDLWNMAKERFYAVLDALRSFNGLVIVTARLDNNAVIGPGGTPTGERIWKIRAQKDLPFDCQVIMQARAPRQWTMTKVTSRYLLMPSEGYMEWPDFTIEELLIRLELDPTAVAERVERSYVRPDPGAASESNGASTNTERASQDHSDEPRGRLAPLPDDLNGVIKALEEALDKPALWSLFQLAKAHQNRIAVAKVESAGKRVARRIEAGETPPSNQSAEQDNPQADGPTEEELAQEAELQRLADEAEAAREAETQHASQGDDPKAQGDTSPSVSSEPSSADPVEPQTKTDESSQTSPDSSAEPSTETSTEDPTAGEVDPDAPPFSADPTDEHPHGRNVWSGVAVADPADRQETPRRKGTVTALEAALGGMAKADDTVFAMKGLSIVECATKELAEVLKYHQGAKVAAG